MPRGDRTGPNGMGPMTGRGAGFCAGYTVPGYANQMGGRGFGAWGGGGRGGGRGGGWRHRNMYNATGLFGWQRAQMGWPNYAMPEAAPQDQATLRKQTIEALKQQAKNLEETLRGINEQLKELEAS